MSNYYSSSDSEEDEPIIRRSRIFRPRANFVFEDAEYLERFRVSKSVFERLYLEIGNHFHHNTSRNMAFTASQQMQIALHFLGSGCQYFNVGDMHGASKATVHRCVMKFCRVVVSKLFSKHVCWPTNPDAAATGFFRYSGIPNVAGSVDGSLVNIIKPKVNEEQYLDRHGDHSINAMMVCGPDLKIYYVNARYPGSVHDARVLRNSAIYDRFENGWRPFPGAILIGDSAYPLRDWIVPYRPPEPGNEVEERLFKALQLSRHLIECTFGALKKKFPCLDYLRLDPKVAAMVIMTTTVLHNMCLDERTENFDPIEIPLLYENLGPDEQEEGNRRSLGLDELMRFFRNN